MEFEGGDDRLVLYVNCGAMQWGELCPLPKKAMSWPPLALLLSVTLFGNSAFADVTRARTMMRSSWVREGPASNERVL